MGFYSIFIVSLENQIKLSGVIVGTRNEYFWELLFGTVEQTNSFSTKMVISHLWYQQRTLYFQDSGKLINSLLLIRLHDIRLISTFASAQITPASMYFIHAHYITEHYYFRDLCLYLTS